MDPILRDQSSLPPSPQAELCQARYNFANATLEVYSSMTQPLTWNGQVSAFPFRIDNITRLSFKDATDLPNGQGVVKLKLHQVGTEHGIMHFVGTGAPGMCDYLNESTSKRHRDRAGSLETCERCSSSQGVVAL